MKALSPQQAEAARVALLAGTTTIAEIAARFGCSARMVKIQTGWSRMEHWQQAAAKKREERLRHA